MRVNYAAHIFSLTVASTWKILKWDNTSVTIDFIRRVNNFFDMLNGAHSQHGKRTRNPNLDLIVVVVIPRFENLQEFWIT